MNEHSIEQIYMIAKPYLTERGRRLVAAEVALAIGNGGTSKVSRATGLARQVIRTGIKELTERTGNAESETNKSERVRKEGGGRKSASELDPSLRDDLLGLLEPATRGDPESALLWTSKSLRRLADELRVAGHNVSHVTVRSILKEAGFSLQADFKTLEKGQHPDRNGQFEHIYSATKEMLRLKQPVISVDTKKRELVGQYKNGGREWAPASQPIKVNSHDFEDPELGHAIPYGVYDVSANSGWVSVGVTKDTSQFAAASILSWWREMGASMYPYAEELMITADSGGSNGCRRRLWKTELQKVADETGLILRICHFPPGTSKWNKIEHRMFSFISKNWRGRPLESLQTIVSLIAATTTDKGLYIKCAVDMTEYVTGIKVSDEELADVLIVPDKYHGEWNYTIFPRCMT